MVLDNENTERMTLDAAGPEANSKYCCNVPATHSPQESSSCHRKHSISDHLFLRNIIQAILHQTAF